jgi:5'-3' exonuclease
MENKKYNILIVDVYNMMFRSTYCSNKEQIVSQGINKYHIEGIINFFNMIDSYIKNYCEDDVYIYWLFDNAKSSIRKYRKSLSENYKKTRVEQPEWFYDSLNNLELILHYYRNNSYIYRQNFVEADDYVSYIIDYSYNKNKNILLVSNDQDWFRGLQSNVDQLYNGEIYDKNRFEEVFKYPPTYSNICFYKCFYGDDSDCIEGFLKNLPHVYFLDIISKYKNMLDFVLEAKQGKIDFLDLGWLEKIKKEEENLLLNWNLVTVIELGDLDLKSSEIVCHYKEEKLKIIYQSLNLIGQIDKRFIIEKKSVDILEDLLSGIKQKR